MVTTIQRPFLNLRAIRQMADRVRRAVLVFNAHAPASQALAVDRRGIRHLHDWGFGRRVVTRAATGH